MGFIKCPRCELNYIEESEGFCKICKREMQGENSSDDVELCTICNERPAMPGKDICLVCLKEMNAANDDDTDDLSRDGEAVESVDESAIGSIDDPVSSMDEIMPDINDDIPESEYSEIENELSLEALSDEEEEEEQEDDESE